LCADTTTTTTTTTTTNNNNNNNSNNNNKKNTGNFVPVSEYHNIEGYSGHRDKFLHVLGSELDGDK
jgi:hypothetical protein